MSKNINDNCGRSKTNIQDPPFQPSDKPEGLLTGDQQYDVIHGRSDLWPSGAIAPVYWAKPKKGKDGKRDYTNCCYIAIRPDDPARHLSRNYHCSISLFKDQTLVNSFGFPYIPRREQDGVQINCVIGDDYGEKIPWDNARHTS